jgi:large subunit ribosomal protein L28
LGAVQRAIRHGRRRRNPEKGPPRVPANTIKNVDHRGGLDAFLIKAKADVLSPRALDLKRAIEKKLPKAKFVKKVS